MREGGSQFEVNPLSIISLLRLILSLDVYFSFWLSCFLCLIYILLSILVRKKSAQPLYFAPLILNIGCDEIVPRVDY